MRVSNVFEANTDDVTISENGGAAKPLLTASGHQVVPGGISSGMLMAYLDAGTAYRLISDQASLSVQAAAEDAANRANASAISAADYSALARNNFVSNQFVSDGSQVDFPLTADPGSANNMWVNANGVLQTAGAYSLQYVSSVPTLRLSAPLPLGVVIDARFGNKVTVGTPADGSITTSKLGADSVTADKIAATEAAAIRTKINAAQSGGAITFDQLPNGTVVGGAYAEYTANANLSAQIPRDDSIPQVGEGTEILTLTITPKSATNKLRCRFRAWLRKVRSATSFQHCLPAELEFPERLPMRASPA